MTYTAYHAPSGEFKDGFETEELAQAYIDEECSYCSCGEKPCEARQCEWFLMLTKDFVECEGFGDILNAAGCVPWTPPEFQNGDEARKET